MKVVRNAIGLVVIAIVLGGCASVKVTDIAKPDGKYIPTIYSAATSGSASRDRSKVLSEIASKTDLTMSEQVYLVDVLDAVRGFSSDVTSVLIALLQNPQSQRKPSTGSLSSYPSWICFCMMPSAL